MRMLRPPSKDDFYLFGEDELHDGVRGVRKLRQECIQIRMARDDTSAANRDPLTGVVADQFIPVRVNPRVVVLEGYYTGCHRAPPPSSFPAVLRDRHRHR